MLNSIQTSFVAVRHRKLTAITLATLCVLTGVLGFASTPALAINTHFFSTSFGAAASTPANPYPLSTPASVAVAANGDAYVADSANAWVEKFDASGKLVLIFGKEVNETAVKASGSRAEEDLCTIASKDICQPGARASAPGAFEDPSFLAVDNSTDLSQGDVYVADNGDHLISKFTAEGGLVESWGSDGQINESSVPEIEGARPAEIAGIAVDPAGNLWFGVSEYLIDPTVKVGRKPTDGVEFSENGTLIQAWESAILTGGATYGGGAGHDGIAVDGVDDLYFSGGSAVDNESPGEIFSAGGDLLAGSLGSSTASIVGIAADPSDEDIYVDYGASISHFVHPCDATECSTAEAADSFGVGYLSEGSGLAVDPATHAIYAVDSGAKQIDVFIPAVLPTVVTGPAPEGANATAVVSGTVNPENIAVTECEFQYGETESYGEAVPCEPNAVEISKISGNIPITVHAELNGLKLAANKYHVRLVAANAKGIEYGQDRSFNKATLPSVSDESFSEAGSHKATVDAQINPRGLPTTYVIEYGTSGAYGSATQPVSLAAGSEAVDVSSALGASLLLLPETIYHFRVVATNADGVTNGADMVFTTLSDFSGLPDGRGYELVSSVDNGNGEVFEPLGVVNGGGNIPQQLTRQPFRASTDGNEVTYVADASITGGNGRDSQHEGNQYLAMRAAAGGWTAVDISPDEAQLAQLGLFTSFSSDLSVGFFGDAYRVNSDGSVHSLPAGVFAGASSGTAAVPASSHILTQGKNLYDSVGGRLSLVNVLPNGATAATAMFGGPGAEVPRPDFNNVISADGSRIFWSTVEPSQQTNPTALYVRENGAKTIEVDASQGPGPSGDGRFWTASGDGSRVFFTDCHKLTGEATAASTGDCMHEGVPTGNDLYEYNVDTGALSDLAIDHNPGDPLGANVRGVLGASEDGEYVYFVATGSLAAENSEGYSPVPGEPNLYLRRSGVTTFIGTLSESDNKPATSNEYEEGGEGDWAADVGIRTAEVTPDGESLVFQSYRSLTGYNNQIEGTQKQAAREVFVYHVDTSRLVCVSCNASGEPPQRTSANAVAFLPDSHSATYMPRWISDDGSRVFFNSVEALVPEDTNGRMDVYEWEQGGSGSCKAIPGCVYLLSGGDSTDNSFLLDASASGDDVFLSTRAQLVAQDRGGSFEVYDARVGASEPPTGQACTGTGCQGLPSAPPLFATPSSVTFNGVGNFPPPAPVAVKKKTAAQVQTEMRSKAFKACRAKRGKKRHTCEATARRNHGAAEKAKKAKAKGARNYRRATR